MPDPNEGYQQKKQDIAPVIHTEPVLINQNAPGSPVLMPGLSRQEERISLSPLQIQRQRTIQNRQLSSMRLFRDALVIEQNEEELSGLKLPPIPAYRDVKKAYEDTDFAITDSPKERTKLLNESKKKRRLTNFLKGQSEESGELRLKQRLAPKEVCKLTDEKLLVRLEALDTGNDYVSARLALIRNRYYALVPEKEIKKLPKSEIMGRLRKLYAESPEKQNKALIDYYQNILIIRHREKEIGAEKDKKERLIENNTEKKAEVTPQKEAGIRSVLAWMKRNCDKSSVSKAPFVKRIENTTSGQQLLMFYLVEKGLQAAPAEEYCFNALTDYVPDVQKIKDRVVASKWKFWKRLGKDASDQVIDWSKLGLAARFALNCDIPDTILQNETDLKQTEAEEEDGAFEELSTEEKRARLMSRLENKGALILSLYRSAGLSPQMPAEIIEDKDLRERLLSLIASFNESQEILEELNLGKHGLKESLDKKVGTVPKGVVSAQGPASDGIASMGKHSTRTMQAVSFLSNADKMLAYDDGPFKSIELGNTGTAVVSGVTGVLGTLQMIANFKTAAGIAKSAAKLTTADHAAKSISVTGGLVKNASDIVSSATTVTQYFQGASVYAPQTSLIGETTVKSASESFQTVSGGIKFCAGCAAIAAGTLNMVAGGIEIGRSVSSRRDLKRAKEKLDMIPDAGKTEAHETLGRFLKHEERVAKNNEISAGVKAATGFLTLAGGILTVTGILAPIGGILSIIGSAASLGYSLFYARHRRNLARMQAVDEALGLDKAVILVRKSDQKKKKPEYAQLDDETLKKRIRQEALAELGYATYKECFIDFCKQNAVTLYQHVFEQERDTPDQKMFEDALKSLGLKIKYPQKKGEKPIPGVAAIFAKMMA